MPIAVAFAEQLDTIGFDLNENKIQMYKRGIDPTKEVGDEAIKKSSLFFTSDNTYLKDAKFFVVAVPTPINQDKTPNLKPVEGASRILGRNLSKGISRSHRRHLHSHFRRGIRIKMWNRF